MVKKKRAMKSSTDAFDSKWLHDSRVHPDKRFGVPYHLEKGHDLVIQAKSAENHARSCNFGKTVNPEKLSDVAKIFSYASENFINAGEPRLAARYAHKSAKLYSETANLFHKEAISDSSLYSNQVDSERDSREEKSFAKDYRHEAAMEKVKRNKKSLLGRIFGSLFVIAGAFFFGNSITANVIGNFTSSNSSILGVVLFAVGLGVLALSFKG